MGLQTPGHVVEATFEADLPGADLPHSRDILDALRYLVPGSVELVGGGISGSLHGLVLENERVKSDNLAMAVEDVDGELARDVAGNLCDVRVDLLLAQHGGQRRSRAQECAIQEDWRSRGICRGGGGARGRRRWEALRAEEIAVLIHSQP